MPSISLSGVIAENIRATNAQDLDAILHTFAADAFITDASREIRGEAGIRAFLAKEIVGDHVSYTPVEVLEHDGLTIVRAVTDGLFDKRALPDPLVLTHYFRVVDEKIASQITILLKEPGY